MKTVVITGASKGIGKAIAKAFAEMNQWNIIICARNTTDLQATKEEIIGQYPNNNFYTYTVDMSIKEQVLDFAQKIKDTVETVDVLVNNAGVFIPGAISEEKEGQLELMMNTNLYSAYHLTRAILPMMKEQQSGHVFNICSVASKIAYPNGGSYSISKFALLGFSKVLREEMKPLGIRVTSVLPGATWSDSWKGVDLPESRLMQAHDVAQMIKSTYLLSPSAVVEDIILRPQLGDL